jgi:hypothetical protein
MMAFLDQKHKWCLDLDIAEGKNDESQTQFVQLEKLGIQVGL